MSLFGTADVGLLGASTEVIATVVEATCETSTVSPTLSFAVVTGGGHSDVKSMSKMLLLFVLDVLADMEADKGRLLTAVASLSERVTGGRLSIASSMSSNLV